MYEATRHYGTPGKTYPCPDAFVSEKYGVPGHNLIPHPIFGNEGEFVCPYEYDQERSEIYQAQLEKEAAEERRTYAGDLAKQYFPFDGSDPNTVIEARKRTADAIVQALIENGEK